MHIYNICMYKDSNDKTLVKEASNTDSRKDNIIYILIASGQEG